MYLKSIPSIAQKIFPEAIWNSHKRPLLQWTFDDGPHPDSTRQLLTLLDEYNITGTFFCSGRNAERYPELVDEILANGHQIGNHGYNHISGWSTKSKDYIDNIQKAKSFLNSNLYRPPYGRITKSQIHYIREELKMEVVLWNLMPGDFDNSVSAKLLHQRLFKYISKTSLVVLHDRPEFIDKLCEGLSIFFRNKSEKQLQRNFLEE